MNKLEKFIYDGVKKSPAVKFALRNIYQTCFDLLPKPNAQITGEVHVKEDYFFGFHDVSPFSMDERRILANHLLIPLRMPGKDECLEVGFFDVGDDGEMGDFHTVGRSYAWNYHKGCRLQWLHEDSVVFNTRRGDSVCSVEVDLSGRVVNTFGSPIDSVSPDGKSATSFSYERLNVLMPGYGYEDCHDGGCLEENAPSATGLSVMDLEGGTTKMLISLRELADMTDGENLDDYRHFVTHTEFSPDGRYIAFLHRWIGTDYRMRHSRLVVYDTMSGVFSIMPTTGMVSHYIWMTGGSLVAYCSVAEGDAHVLFDVEDGSYAPILLGRLNVDGHQSRVSDDVFVTDTYPDRHRMASIYMVDIKNARKTRLTYVRSPRRFQTKDFHKHIACDLHPRVSPSGRFVCYDTVMTGKRGLAVQRFS